MSGKASRALPGERQPLHRLCQPDHWRLEPVWGITPGYALALVCMDEHLHHAALAQTYREARALIRQWQREILPPAHPGIMIADYGAGRLILPDGRRLPLLAAGSVGSGTGGTPAS